MQIACDRLLINDSNIPDQEIRDCLWDDLPKNNIELINGFELWEKISDQLLVLSRTVDRILLPWFSVSIFLRCTGFLPPIDKTIFLPSIKRILEGMTPRGISISDDDLAKLSECSSDEDILLLDDVIASGTTLNWISKRMGKSDLRTATLIKREPNQLKSSLSQNVLSPCTVVPRTVKFPAINTLSSLRDPAKVDTILFGFRHFYGEQFASRIQGLFLIP